MRKHIRPLLWYILATVSIIGLAACEKDLKLKDPSGPHRIVLLGELIAGDSVALRGGQTQSPLSGGNFELPRNMEVAVSGGFGTYAASGREDFLSQVLYTLAYNIAAAPEAGQSYTVTAKDPDLGEAHAHITVPPPFTAVLVDTQRTVLNGEQLLQVQIRIQDPPATGYYVIETLDQTGGLVFRFFYEGKWRRADEESVLYDSLKNAGANVDERLDTVYTNVIRRPLLTYDPHVLNSSNGAQRSLRRILLTDEAFNGQPYTITFYIPADGLSAMPGELKRLALQVKSVAPEYFAYLRSYEKLDPYAGFGYDNAPVVQLPTNLTNGLGMIGGVYRQQLLWYFNE